jgi:hypothetical protein
MATLDSLSSVEVEQHQPGHEGERNAMKSLRTGPAAPGRLVVLADRGVRDPDPESFAYGRSFFLTRARPHPEAGTNGARGEHEKQRSGERHIKAAVPKDGTAAREVDDTEDDYGDGNRRDHKAKRGRETIDSPSELRIGHRPESTSWSR